MVLVLIADMLDNPYIVRVFHTLLWPDALVRDPTGIARAERGSLVPAMNLPDMAL